MVPHLRFHPGRSRRRCRPAEFGKTDTRSQRHIGCH